MPGRVRLTPKQAKRFGVKASATAKKARKTPDAPIRCFRCKKTIGNFRWIGGDDRYECYGGCDTL